MSPRTHLLVGLCVWFGVHVLVGSVTPYFCILACELTSFEALYGEVLDLSSATLATSITRAPYDSKNSRAEREDL